jgi:hypothetical protein
MEKREKFCFRNLNEHKKQQITARTTTLFFQFMDTLSLYQLKSAFSLSCSSKEKGTKGSS